jgi:hypothetical protein
MINLIPKEEKKKMTTDFRYRLATLFFATLDFCLLVAVIAILPAYLNSSINNSSIATQLETQKNKPLPVLGEQSLSIIKDMNSKIITVENAEKNKFPVSTKVINAILINKRADIKITQIVYENDPAAGKKIKITGTAPSREVLLLFREALERSPSFKSVDLPISNFIKGANIEFYLSAVPA